MSEAKVDESDRPAILVKQKDSTDYICNKTCFLLKKKTTVVLSGLEGAIIVAVDAAAILEQSGLVSIQSIKTSFPEITSRATGLPKKRSKIEIVLQRKFDPDLL